MTAVGAQQALDWQMITDPKDRHFVPEAVQQASHPPSLPSPVPPTPLPPVGSILFATTPDARGSNMMAVDSLTRAGMSPLGARQILNAEIVAKPADRLILARMLKGDKCQ